VTLVSGVWMHFGDAAHEQHEANVEQRKADESRF
jgi:hypothetical protein